MANKYRFDFGCDGWKDCVLASDYDTMVADRDQISLTLAVAKADRDKWFGRARALEAALRKLGYATVEYVGKRGDGNAFADLVQAEHDARALLPSQVPGVNKDVARTLRKDQEMPMVKRWECDCEADDNVPTDAAYVGAVLGADYDALAAELAEVKCRHNLFVMDMCKVVPERNELKARVAALEAALRKLGYATVEYVGKRGDGNAFADLVQAEHDARALLPSQVPGVNKDGSYTPETPVNAWSPPKDTGCWKCGERYPIDAAKCLHCGAANANVDIEAASAEASTSDRAGK